MSLLNGSEFLNCITPTPGKSANVLFQWQISDNGTDFSNIAGATAEDYTPVAITTATAITKYFRRLVKAANSAEVQPLNSSNTIPIITVPEVL